MVSQTYSWIFKFYGKFQGGPKTPDKHIKISENFSRADFLRKCEMNRLTLNSDCFL